MPLPRRRSAAVAALVLAAMLLAACGGDDDEPTEAATRETAADDAAGEETADEDAPEGDLQAYCEASLALETVPEPDIDFDTATPEELAAAGRSFASETLRPIADDLEAHLPPELTDAYATLDAAITEMAETGDPSVFESPEVSEADATAHAFDLANCGWETVDVQAIDYAFQGIPSSLPAGVVSFEFTNESGRDEFHELVLFRKKDGVTESALELLEQGEEQAGAKVEEVGGTGAEPGGSEPVVTELEPGEYAAVCFVPVGASEENPEGSGPPHFVQGMVVEFTVE